MTKQTINVGIVANDKRGDPLRTAFTKTNQNFTELYTLVGTIPTDINELEDSDNLLSGGADLGEFKISGYTLGTKGTGNSWGGGPVSIDPGGESSSGIYIPSPDGQQNNGQFQIYHNNVDSGNIQLLTNAGSWDLTQDGKLSGPITYESSNNNLELDTNLLMNRDRGFVIEMGRFPHAENGDDWWFDAVVNKDGYIYALGGNDIDGTPTIVKFDRYGDVVWQKNYTVPEIGVEFPILVSADWNSNNTLSVVGNGYDYTNDKQYTIYFEVDPSSGDITGTAPYTLVATDETNNQPANIYSNQIRYNSDKTDYAIVGEKFGDVTDLNISAPSSISTTPGVLKILKSTIDSTFGNITPLTYSNAWVIFGYGLTGINQFTDVATVTEEGIDYYNLTTDSSVDFSVLPEAESWGIRYFDEGNALIMTDSWSKTFDTGGDYDWFSSVVFDTTGNIYLGGGSNGQISGTSGYTSLLISLQANGTTRWAKRIEDENGNGWNAIQGLAIDTANGKLFTVARDDSGQTVIARIAAATGNVEWIKTMTIDDGVSGNYYARIVYCAHDNTIVVALEYGSITSYNDDYLLLKLNADGSLNWVHSIGSSGEDNVNWDFGQDFLSADDQYIYLSGSTYTQTHDDNATVYAIPHDGVVSGWVGKFNIRDASANINLVTGSAAGNNITGLTSSSSVSVGDDSYTTEAVDNSYPTRKVNLNGGVNKIKNVAEIKFADGTTQRTSATYVPQSRLVADNSITINSNDVGGHILFPGDWGNSTLYVPLHEEDPLPIGSTVTLILDQFVVGNKVYVTGNSSEGGTVYIRPIGSDVYQNQLWSVGGDDVQGLYTLMKIDNNVWILSGQTINNED